MALCSFSATPSDNSALHQACISPSKREAVLLPSPLLPEGNLWNVYYCLGIANGHLTPDHNQVVRGLLPGLHSAPWMSSISSISLMFQ